MKQLTLNILTLKTWLIILKIIQLVKQMLKKRLNTLKIIKTSEIKHKRLIPGQKELLYLLDLLDTILTDKTLMSSKEENKQLKENKKIK